MRGKAEAVARSLLRELGKDPKDISPDEALVVLDDFERTNPNHDASVWYRTATDNQIRLFKREWQGRQRYYAERDRLASAR